MVYFPWHPSPRILGQSSLSRTVPVQERDGSGLRYSCLVSLPLLGVTGHTCTRLADSRVLQDKNKICFDGHSYK